MHTHDHVHTERQCRFYQVSENALIFYLLILVIQGTIPNGLMHSTAHHERGKSTQQKMARARSVGACTTIVQKIRHGLSAPKGTRSLDSQHRAGWPKTCPMPGGQCAINPMHRLRAEWGSHVYEMTDTMRAPARIQRGKNLSDTICTNGHTRTHSRLTRVVSCQFGGMMCVDLRPAAAEWQLRKNQIHKYALDRVYVKASPFVCTASEKWTTGSSIRPLSDCQGMPFGGMRL